MNEAVFRPYHGIVSFDVAEAIDLGRVQRELGAGVEVRLAPKPCSNALNRVDR